jgi:hypothetical protein
MAALVKAHRETRIIATRAPIVPIPKFTVVSDKIKEICAAPRWMNEYGVGYFFRFRICVMNGSQTELLETFITEHSLPHDMRKSLYSLENIDYVVQDRFASKIAKKELCVTLSIIIYHQTGMPCNRIFMSSWNLCNSQDDGKQLTFILV